MKQIIIFLILLAFVSCNASKATRDLDEIASYVENRPDEALMSLNKLKKQHLPKSREVECYLALLTIQAKDLCDMDISCYIYEIKEILEYYQSTDERSKQVLAYYYAGRIQVENGDALAAVKYYQHALSILGKKPTSLSIKIYDQLGYLYTEQDLYDDAFGMHGKAASIAEILNDTLGMVRSFRDMGSNCRDLNKQLAYIQKAYSLAKQTHNQQLISETCAYLAISYKMIGNFDEALRYLLIAEKCIAKSDTSAIYNIKADVYNSVNTDSAKFYYHYLTLHGNLYNKSSAFQYLISDAIKNSNLNQVAAYFEKYKNVTDSIQMQTNSEMLAKVKGIYDYHQKEIETSKALEAKRKTIMWASFILILFIVLFGFSCVLIMHLKRKNREVKRKNLLLSRILDNTVEHKNRQIEVNKERIAALELLLANAQKEQSIKMDKIVAERNSLLRTNVVSEAEVEEYRIAFDNLKQTAIVKKIFKMIKVEYDDHLSLADKESLEAAFDLYMPDFKERLYAIYDMNARELWVSMLIKLNVAPIDIAQLLACTRSAVSKIRKRLYSKFFGQDGKAEEWDMFIKSL